MLQPIEILRQFSHECFVSGEVVAQRLGISRASVHNAIRLAKDYGLTVHALPGRGYRLAQPVTWLDESRLADLFTQRAIAPVFFPALDSTNGWLLAQRDVRHKTLVFAEWQDKGRGRRGRSWLTGLGAGLTFSLAWRFDRPVSDLSGLSLVVGLSLVKCLRDLGLALAAVKWPNDVLVGNAKLAGVLIELVGDMLGPSLAVIGVGLNVMGSGSLQGAVSQPVTDVTVHLGQIDRNLLLRDLVGQLDDDLLRFERSGFDSFREEWAQFHAFQNQRVQLTPAMGDCIVGEAVGVDASGALLLADANGLRRFHSGEVSLRPLP